MSAADWIVVSIVILWAGLALFSVFRSHKKGGDCSCKGCCPCEGCSSCAKTACPNKNPTVKK